MTNSSKIRTQYLQAFEEHGFEVDDAQLNALDALARIQAELTTRTDTGLLPRWLKAFLPGPQARVAPAKGAYLWGGVGRGKTFVMDLFFASLPFPDKQRFHFHRMMYRVHKRLAEITDQEDPIALVAEEFAEQARVICFDEFFVSDIGDAMILGKLLDALFSRGVTLVATSNIPPDQLYRDGLQRQQFLSAITLIKQHTDVVHVDGDCDYRLRVLEQAEIWHSPLNNVANQNLHEYFGRIAPEEGTAGDQLEILGRNIDTIRRADGIIWFDFDVLCDGPRSQSDYIEIAKCFQTVLVSDIPVLDGLRENAARRFISLIDEFYDRRVKVIVSAESGIDTIYTGKKLAMEFNRTRSRLLEMQSSEYLATAHLP
ncbi:MAG: cell division protein ZapE [Gammaproteobacteria bacterium]